MRNLHLLILLFCLISCKTSQLTEVNSDGQKSTEKYRKFDGFFTYYWDEETGKIFLEIDSLNQEFLYVNYLSAGVGSNDIGLDRGQIGNTRIVQFQRSGPKIFLVQNNYSFRAISKNKNEVQSVEEAFAKSVIWGFKIVKNADGKLLIDLTDFLLSDVHGVGRRIKTTGQGSYKPDPDRSAVYLDRTKNFRDNSEFESTITFIGDKAGSYLSSVVPTAEAVTVRMHHSFIRLPDDKYEPRKYDPRAGFYGISYKDYATPINESLVKQFIVRHRLEKENKNAETSKPIKPIIYYVDKGAPEPVRSALIEGAAWWNEAFEAAGFTNAFQVKVLPDSADPLDIRYNVIQWVHRSTRGWSYGSSVVDPRTGEIIKGHVSLGSLRIRQDFLIATGLLQPYKEGKAPGSEMEEMALARLRQLSAHEVGHTLGLYHNFAASVNERASVMDYPYPLIRTDDAGNVDLKDAYGVGIGDWDKFAIKYGYMDSKDSVNGPEEVINDWINKGYNYIMDNDARPAGGSHAQAHLWDNGSNAAMELRRINQLRGKMLDSFSIDAIKIGDPISSLEEVLVPVYFMHRYQVEAASKLVAGQIYSYKVKGDALPFPKKVAAKEQTEAMIELINTLDPDFLSLPNTLLDIMNPKAPGYPKTRESFPSNTSPDFDPIAAAESSAELTLKMLFNMQRIERLLQQNLQDPTLPAWSTLMSVIYTKFYDGKYPKDINKAIKMMVESRIFYHLANLATSNKTSELVKSVALKELSGINTKIKNTTADDFIIAAHYERIRSQYARLLEDPKEFVIPDSATIPDGSPIGMDCLSD